MTKKKLVCSLEGSSVPEIAEIALILTIPG
jgi:hypothetical protein